MVLDVFFNKNVATNKITGQLQVTRTVWKDWLRRANSNPSHSYASVVQQGKPLAVDRHVQVAVNGYDIKPEKKFTKNTSKTQQIVSKGSNKLSGVNKSNDTASPCQDYRTNDQPLLLCNRFEVLAQLQDSEFSSQSHVGSTNAAFSLKGNKNEKGKYWVHHYMVVQCRIAWNLFIPLSGAIKTKQGKYWVVPCVHSNIKVLTTSCKKVPQQKHASLVFKGNKNGKFGQHVC